MVWSAVATIIAALVAVLSFFGIRAGDDDPSHNAADRDTTSSSARPVDDRSGASAKVPTATEPSTTTTSTTPSTVLLSFLEPVVSEGGWTTGDTTINTVPYPHSVIRPTDCVCCSGGRIDVVEYNLGKKYGKLSAVVGLSDDSRAGYQARIAMLSVAGETPMLLEEWVVTLGSAIPIEVNVSQVLRLRIQVEWLFNDLCGPSGTPVMTAALGAPTLSHL